MTIFRVEFDLCCLFSFITGKAPTELGLMILLSLEFVVFIFSVKVLCLRTRDGGRCSSVSVARLVLRLGSKTRVCSTKVCMEAFPLESNLSDLATAS